MGLAQSTRSVVYIIPVLLVLNLLYLAHSGTLPTRLADCQNIVSSKTGSNGPTNVQHANLPESSPTMASQSLPDFPRKIWQTAKTSPGSMGEDDRKAVTSWTKMNQKYRYESMTAFSAESYVRERFASRPDLVEVFIDLQDAILRADLIRYLVLLSDGGVYSDVDTRALQPIDHWIPESLAPKVSVVVGVEYDVLDGNRWSDWTLDLQFCTWTMMSRAGHPLMEKAVERVVAGLKKLARKQGVTISGIKASYHDVLDTTGPALFTEAVFEYLTEKIGQPYTWKNVTNLKHEILVEDVLILPINAFGSGQAHSHSGSVEADDAYVSHMFKGSWKGDHPMAKPEKDTKPEADKKLDDKKSEDDEKLAAEDKAEDPKKHEDNSKPADEKANQMKQQESKDDAQQSKPEAAIAATSSTPQHQPQHDTASETSQDDLRQQQEELRRLESVQQAAARKRKTADEKGR